MRRFKDQSVKIVFVSFLVGACLATYICLKFQKKEIVEKIQERERVVTKIEERPDGSKTTTIVSDKKSDKTAIKPVTKKDWFVSAMYKPSTIPQYGISIDRRILGDIYVGAALAKSEAWLRVGISF